MCVFFFFYNVSYIFLGHFGQADLTFQANFVNGFFGCLPILACTSVYWDTGSVGRAKDFHVYLERTHVKVLWLRRNRRNAQVDFCFLVFVWKFILSGHHLKELMGSLYIMNIAAIGRETIKGLHLARWVCLNSPNSKKVLFACMFVCRCSTNVPFPPEMATIHIFFIGLLVSVL